MALKFFITVVLHAIGTLAWSQLSIKYNNKEINYHTAEIQYSFVHSANLTDSTLKNLPATEWKNLVNTALPISYSSYTTWLKIPISSIKKMGNFDFVNINNPHVNFLKCWIIQQDTIVKSFTLTGDNEIYGSRQLSVTSFVFPINSKMPNDYEVVLAADKRFTKLDLPISFCSFNYFVVQDTNKGLLFGIIIGICFLLLIFCSYLIVVVKQKFYVWYCLYLFLVIIYLLANGGYLFKYVLPNIPQFNDVIRPIALSLFEVLLLLFFIHLLDIKSKFPKLFFYINRVIHFYLIVFAIAVCSLSFGSYKTHGILLNVMGFIVPSFLIFSLSISFYFVIKKVLFSVFVFLSFLSFTIFILIYSFQQKEFISSTPLTQYSNYLAIFFESAIATILIARQYKHYRDNTILLQEKNIQIQQKIFEEIAVWQETEMHQMSSFLHDSLGANLGLLRLEIDNMTLSERDKYIIAAQITHLGNEVRNMSHSYSPIILKDKGLHNAITDIVHIIRNNSSIDLQFEWLGEELHIKFHFQIIIYRIIQELLQNMLKYANASNGFLQVMIQEKIVSIYVEDNGKGINNKNLNSGIGLRSIENLIQTLKGNFRIESKENEGFCVSIEFNMLYNEKI
jgi:signal transduction histidine kinase